MLPNIVTPVHFVRHRCYLFALMVAHLSFAAFTVPTSVYGGGWVEKNAAGTWCYYPQQGGMDTGCTGGPNSFLDAQFTAVLRVHLNQTSSIGYYGPDLVRFGGAEWPVPQNAGKVTNCLSGMAGDGGYMTICRDVASDNYLSMSEGPDFGACCDVGLSQPNVNDGCYTPGQNSLVGASARPSGTGSPSPSVAGSGMSRNLFLFARLSCTLPAAYHSTQHFATTFVVMMVVMALS
jgi:hypothetical protein